MNMDIRSHILNNFKNDNKETIKNAIEESIENNDEITLPGMGVFMEVLWNHANEELKDSILKTLEENI